MVLTFVAQQVSTFYLLLTGCTWKKQKNYINFNYFENISIKIQFFFFKNILISYQNNVLANNIVHTANNEMPILSGFIKISLSHYTSFWRQCKWLPPVCRAANRFYHHSKMLTGSNRLFHVDAHAPCTHNYETG